TISNGAIGAYNPNPNSYVYSINKVGSNLYLGGQFTQINGTARNYLSSTNVTGTLQSWNPSANSTVNKINTDASNNIIVGGNFSGFQDVTRTYASVIKYTTQILANWTPVLNNVVYDVTYNANKIFIGGVFTTANGSARSGVAAFNLSGTLQSTNLNLTKGGSSNVGVYSLFATSTNIYVGGDFDKAGANVRNDFVEANISSGAGTILNTNPTLDDIVYAINVQGSTIAYGGNFRFSNFIDRRYLASFRISTGTITNWNPLPDSYVFDIAVNYNKIFIVGQFDNVNASPHPGAAAFTLSNGALQSWNPQLSRAGQGYYADLNCVLADSNYVYLGGNFDQVAGNTRNNAAIVAATNAALQSWNAGPNSIVRALALNKTNLFIGGDFTYCKGAARSYIAKIDSATGLVNTSWNPGANSYVYAITGNGTNIYIGGIFTQLAGITRTALGAVSSSTGTATSFDPVIQSNGGTGTVYTLAFDASNVLYVGGSFNTAKGSARNNLAAYAISGSGTLNSWNPNANNAVYTLAVAGTKIYVGGSFTTLIGGTTRNYLACANNTNGTITTFNPNMNSYVRGLSVSGNNTLYVGGQFTTVNGGTSRSYTAAYDATTGSLKSWNPVPNNAVYGIAAQTDTVYMGGYFTTVNGSSFNRLAAVRGTAGTTNFSSFNPNVNNLVFNEFISEKTLLAGGYFSTVGGFYRNGFAVFKLPGSNSLTSTDNNNVIAESAVAKQLENKAFTIYPNPASQNANIKFANALSGKFVVTITDMNGNKILQKDVSGDYSNFIKLDVSKLKSGNYIISVNSDNFNGKQSLIIAK
ncbi:MAG TPA: T9SS type A sorting domain-containing protein, partial [Parafilimonas sp.]|nr:T9SS type A sorting domain-containing protein [Parafilimonas sp.]